MKKIVWITIALAVLWLPRALAQALLPNAVRPCIERDRDECLIPGVLPLPPASLPRPAPALPLPLPGSAAVPSLPTLPTQALPGLVLPMLPGSPLPALPGLPNLPLVTPAQQVLRELLQDPFQPVIPVLGPTSPLLGVNPCNDPLACIDSPIAQQAFAATCTFERAPEIHLDFGTLVPPGPQAEAPRASSSVLVRCGPGVRYRFRLVQGARDVGDGTLTVRVGREETRLRIESDGQPVQTAVFTGTGETQEHAIDAVLLANTAPTALHSGRLEAPSDVRLMLDW